MGGIAVDQGYPPGVEISLGKKNPLQAWWMATVKMKNRLLKDSDDDLGFDIANEISAGGAEIGVRKVVLRAWNSAGGSKILPTFIRSPFYNNQWIDMESKGEKMLSFVDVVKLSKR
jgi:hypothetical protein